MGIYIVTRYFDNGKVFAKMTSKNTYKERSDGDYDQYVEPISDSYTLEDWRDDMGLGFKDMEELALFSDSDHWIDFTALA